ncbi:methylated-DNA--[protein]-cysteine S-methyltransferase [Arthrobacter mangrovi]|uniref:Methylated-DNA--protein-cysteine methyltransferase n=1 Tax=Arthrobacter mangrovi TaxID=2966350 RepID=A0ABQ5MZ25_9MICC|nr:methylated-DNA--[protein]-cysteine S-methyltransferase [Arthrobacter mangrovi]GLB69206.1 methylated-DNA--protein-cysteine methyltransferase [Arthrobacter mangrovi]
MTSPSSPDLLPARTEGVRPALPEPLERLSIFEGALLEQLHGRLESAAREADLLDVAYTTIDSPLGPLLLAATSQGLVRVAFANEDHGVVLAALAAAVSPRILRAPERLAEATGQLEEYFAGHRRTFDLPLDRRLSKGFRLSVHRHLPLIPYGSTESYAQVAAAVGNPRAVRAVGSACATNPLPVVIPCHRVLRSDGSPGGYLGGPRAKAWLLGLEAAA